jgi:hypothetical protein
MACAVEFISALPGNGEIYQIFGREHTWVKHPIAPENFPAIISYHAG